MGSCMTVRQIQVYREKVLSADCILP